MSNVNKIVLGGFVIGVAAILGTWYLWQGDRQTVLSTDSADRQEQLEALLVSNGIQFERDEQNRVTVMSEDLLIARALADQASLTLPERSGFELFENEDYGATEFVQRINYQRALQAELERTVIRIAGIRNARVHILQPNRSTFFKRDSVSRASVVLELERGVHLSAVAPSVAELLIGAIDGLKLDDVKIISGHGDIVAASHGDAAVGLSSMQSAADQMEERLAETIYRVLNPLYDRSSIGVSVSVDLDRTTRSVRRQNSPTVGNVADAAASEASLLVDAGSQVVTENVSMPPGEILRIGVGVMLPHPTTDVEIAQIEDLLHSGLGLSEARGDTLSVMAYRHYDVPVKQTATEVILPVASRQPPVRGAMLANVVPLSTQQFNIVLVVASASFLLLLIVKVAMRRRQKRKVVGLVSDWVQDAAHE